MTPATDPQPEVQQVGKADRELRTSIWRAINRARGSAVKERAFEPSKIDDAIDELLARHRAAAHEAGRVEGVREGLEALDRPDAADLIAQAIEQGDINYGMRLTRLVDGESTYTLTYSDGREPLEFPDTDELYEHVRQTKRAVQAAAVLAAIRAISKEPTK